MPTTDELNDLHDSLSDGPKTTAQVAIDCKWSLPDAFAKLTELEAEGVIEKVSPASRALNRNTIRWRDVHLSDLLEDGEQDSGSSEPPPAEGALARPGPYRRPALSRAPKGPASPARGGSTPTAKPRTVQPGGNFWLGLLVGTFGGLIIVLLVYRRSRAETRRGVLWGLALNVLSLVLLKIFSV